MTSRKKPPRLRGGKADPCPRFGLGGEQPEQVAAVKGGEDLGDE